MVLFQSLPFGGVKDSGFGRFAGVEGLRACCLVKSVAEDRWWPFVKTIIPKPIQVNFIFSCPSFSSSLVHSHDCSPLPNCSILWRRMVSSFKNHWLRPSMD